jgi:hypothetical protein
MATLGQLANAIANAEGIERERVSAIARSIREAFLLSSKGRGPSAAQMDAQDAANLLIAVNAAYTAKEAPVVVRSFRSLPARRREKSQSEFGTEFEALISAFRDNSLPSYLVALATADGGKKAIRAAHRYNAPGQYRISVTFERPTPVAVISVEFLDQFDRFDAVASLSFSNVRAGEPKISKSDRSDLVKFTGKTLDAVGAALRGP